MVTVTIAGLSPEQLIDVQTDDVDNDELGEAEIEMADTDANRTNFAPGDDVEIDWGNGIEWRGDIVGRPSESAGRLTYRALGESLPFKHEQAFRVFYETESSEAVKALLTEETEQLPATLIHAGDDPANWSSQSPVAEAYNGGRAGLYEFGVDLIVIGAREGHSGDIQATYESVPSDAIEDGFFELETRLIFPAVSGFWSLTIDLKTPGGTSYRWEPDLRAGEKLYTLAVEDAEPEDPGLDSGELRYTLSPNGIVGQLTLMGIDHAATVPFATSARSNAPDVSGVEATGRDITRRFDGSVGASVQDLAVEDNADWRIVDNTAYYQPGGDSETASLSITAGSTPVVTVQTDRDFEEIRNAVVVQGADGIEVTARNQASIDFYGPVPRPEPISDPSLTSEAEAEARGDGFLEDAAWNDATVSFDIADLDYAQLNAGERIPVTWSPEGLDGTYTIENVVANSDGIVTVTITASTARN